MNQFKPHVSLRVSAFRIKPSPAQRRAFDIRAAVTRWRSHLERMFPSPDPTSIPGPCETLSFPDPIRFPEDVGKCGDNIHCQTRKRRAGLVCSEVATCPGDKKYWAGGRTHCRDARPAR